MIKYLPVLVLIFLFIACKREEPVQANTPAIIKALTQLEQYNTNVPEPSGLAYNSKTNTLFTVSDGNSTVYEIDFTGKILRSFVIASSDLEGIAISSNCDTFYVAEETKQVVTKYLMNGTKLSSFPVNVALDPSKSLEGVTVDNKNHIFVLNEKTPCMILEFIGNKEVLRKELTYSIDCSDIFYDASADCLWMVSDESKTVDKLSKTGESLGVYSLPFPKGEGICIVQNKIYIINDSDAKLTVFQKP